MKRKIPYGVSPSEESWIVLPSGQTLAFESYDENDGGTSYVRFLDKNGGELAYWDVREWEESGEEVMGAIMGAIVGGAGDMPGRPHFYYWADDVEFRKGQRMTAD